MTLAQIRLLAASLALVVAVAPLGASASPYRVVAGSSVSAAAALPEEEGASAQPLSDDPALEYRLGEQAYALGNYEQAVLHFERSYQLSNFAELLYNLGKSYAQWYDLNGDLSLLRKAKRLFQNYTKRLTENPEMDQSQRAEAEAQIAWLDQQIAAEEARQAAAPVVVAPVVSAPEPSGEPSRPDQPARRPVYKRGWFWGVLAGIVVAGAVTTAVVLTRRPGFEPELGSIGPNSSGVALRF